MFTYRTDILIVQSRGIFVHDLANQKTAVFFLHAYLHLHAMNSRILRGFVNEQLQWFRGKKILEQLSRTRFLRGFKNPALFFPAT